MRLLTSYGTNTFAYNADGIRVRKNNTYYTLDGSNIMHEYDNNGKNIYYYYGVDGLYGFRIGEDDYFYKKNLQGDITDIYHEDGTKYASYEYDAWGNCTITLDTNGIGTLNPFRYRGYYYDAETNLYYLQSRYYDPAVGRFLNQDILLDKRSILGYNLYTYCNNNSISNVDCNGAACKCVTQRVSADHVCEEQIYIWSVPISKMQNHDGTYSLYDNMRHNDDTYFHEQILVLELGGSSDSFTIGNSTLVSVKAAFYRGGWEFENFDLSLLDFGTAQAEIGVDNSGFIFSVGASAWSPSTSFDIGFATITLEGKVGAVGCDLAFVPGEIKLGAAFKVGGSVSITWNN